MAATKKSAKRRPNKQHALKGARLISLGKRLNAKATELFLSTREDDARLLMIVADCAIAEGKASRTLR